MKLPVLVAMTFIAGCAGTVKITNPDGSMTELPQDVYTEQQRLEAVDKWTAAIVALTRTPDTPGHVSEAGEIAHEVRMAAFQGQMPELAASLMRGGYFDLQIARSNNRWEFARTAMYVLAPPLIALAIDGFDRGGLSGGCSQDIQVTGSGFGGGGRSGDEAGNAGGIDSLTIGGCGNVQDSQDVRAGFANRWARILESGSTGTIGRNPQFGNGAENQFAPIDDSDRPNVGINPF